MTVLKKVENLKNVAIEMDFHKEFDCESEDAIGEVAKFWMEKCICKWQQLKEILEKCEEFGAVGDVKLLEQYNCEGIIIHYPQTLIFWPTKEAKPTHNFLLCCNRVN